MTTRHKNKKTKKKNVKKQVNKENLNKIRFLEVALKFSLRAANGSSEGLDRLFTNQANRIIKEIEKIKEGQ